MFRLRGLEINNPVWIGSGPLSARAELVQKAEKHGAGGVALKLTFRQPPISGNMRSFSLPGQVLISPIDKRLKLEEGVRLLESCHELGVSIPLVANIAAAGDDEEAWRDLVFAFELCGADGIELNLCCPNLHGGDRPTDGRRMGAQLGQNPDVCFRVTKWVREMTDLPVVCKFLPNALDVREVAKACEEGGADALHVVGMPAAGLPDVSLDSSSVGRPLIPLLGKISYGGSNGPVCRFSTYMSVAQVASVTDLPIFASGGIRNWQDAATAILWGASAVAMCTEILWRGWHVVRNVADGLFRFVEACGAKEWLALRGRSREWLCAPADMCPVPGSAVVDQEKCVGCKACLAPGHCDAISMEKDRARVDASRCIGCGICASLCKAGAIHFEQARK